MAREALLYDTLADGKVRCGICQRRCIIGEGERGYCHTRENQGGKLYSLVYGEVASISINPIEKKPVFHFYPGSRWLSLGTLGCNFRCPGCQNWELSHAEIRGEGTRFLSPEELIQLAQQHDCLGISWTFNEPTIWFEYTLDGAKLAKEKGLYTNYVTNGYITPQALDLLAPYLDVFRVDVKGFSQEAYHRLANISDFRGVLQSTKRAKQNWGMHVEVVTNVIPGYNDDEEQLRGLASWIRRELGEGTPWHITRFFPHLRLLHLEPTPIATLKRGLEIAREEGLHYAYLGNVPGHSGENTYCHRCGSLLVQRFIFDVKQYNLEGSRCRYCGAEIPGSFALEAPVRLT
jgi:pyruvate formate lyase activating enzyme